MAKVSRSRSVIWLDASDDDNGFDVHTEDDMVSIEAVAGDGTEIEVFICPDLFDRVIYCIERIRARGHQR